MKVVIPMTTRFALFGSPVPSISLRGSLLERLLPSAEDCPATVNPTIRTPLFSLATSTPHFRSPLHCPSSSHHSNRSSSQTGAGHAGSRTQESNCCRHGFESRRGHPVFVMIKVGLKRWVKKWGEEEGREWSERHGIILSAGKGTLEKMSSD